MNTNAAMRLRRAARPAALLLAAVFVLPLAAGGADPSGAAAAEKILARMHGLNQMAIRVGELAQQRAQGEDVRAYGERAVLDHRFADGKVLELARDRGISLEPEATGGPSAAGPLQAMRKQASQLQQAPAERFDAMYLQMMVKMHEQAISMLTSAREQLGDESPSGLIENLVPILGQHRELAHRLLERRNLAS